MYDNVNKLVGLVVKFIDDFGDEILIVTECGRRFTFNHSQDCCESVSIYDSVGNLKVLEGQKLVSETDIPEDVDLNPYESYTWTEITFKTNKDTVISRWIGESNGYYSESVEFNDLGG